jgi:GNAT superfamily N-acetyltransferase
MGTRSSREIVGRVEIVIAKASDLDGINKVNRETNEEPKPLQKAPDDLPVSLIEKRDNQITFVAKSDAGVLGYLRLESSESMQKPVDADFILFVRPKYQGKRIGTKLMRHVAEYVAARTKVSRLTLGVMNTNPEARRVYDREGYYSLWKDSIGEKMAKDIKR